MFKVYAEKGFQVTFANGWTISVMFGAGNYCEHHSNEKIEPFRNSVPVWNKHESEDAEVAVIKPNGNFCDEFPGCPEYDQVLGRINSDDVLNIMVWTASQPPV